MGVRSPETGVADSCELIILCGYWELNSDSLEEGSVLLTTELSIHPQKNNF